MALHEAGREHLRRRLGEASAALDAAAARTADEVSAVEARRAAEARAHRERVDKVAGTLDEFMEQLKRERLDVDEWARSRTSYEALAALLRDEVAHADALAGRQRDAHAAEMAVERTRCVLAGGGPR